MITEKQLAELSVKGGPSYVRTLRDVDRQRNMRVLVIGMRIDSILIETSLSIDPASILIIRKDAVYELTPEQVESVMKMELGLICSPVKLDYLHHEDCVDTYIGQYASTLADSIELSPKISSHIFAVLKLWLVKALFDNTNFDLPYFALSDLYCDVQNADPCDKSIKLSGRPINLSGLIHTFERGIGIHVRRQHTYVTTQYPFMLTDKVSPVIREILTAYWGSNHIQNGNTYMITLLELTALYLVINLQQKAKAVSSRALNYLLPLWITRRPFGQIMVSVFMAAGAYRNGGSLAIAESSACDQYKRLANAICMLLNNGIPCHLSLIDADDVDDTIDDYADTEEVPDDKAPPVLTLVDIDK